jgi:hypothetical protein
MPASLLLLAPSGNVTDAARSTDAICGVRTASWVVPSSIDSSTGPDALLLCPRVALRRLGCCILLQTETGVAPIFFGCKPGVAELTMQAVQEAVDGDSGSLRMLPGDQNAMAGQSRLICRRHDVLLLGPHGVLVVTSGNTLQCMRCWSKLALLHFLDIPRDWDARCALVLERLLRYL